jgi:DNA-binding transcriptional LysR family regulator
MHWADRIGRRVKLRDLHILLAVSQSGSMAKAADRLAISHPVISKTISDLEHALGVRLFDRSSTGVEPTEYGQALLKCGVAVFDEMRQGMRQIEYLADPTSGEIRIGCSEPLAAGLVPAVTERLLRQHPRIVLHVLHSSIASLQYNELRERNVELVLGRIQTPFVENDLVAETLFDEHMLVMTGTRNRWTRRRHIELAELIDEPWILSPPESLPGMVMTDVFRAAGLALPRASLVTLSVHFCSMMLATGRFVTLLPGSMMHFNAKRLPLKILPVKLPAQPKPVGVITVKNRTLSPLAERFIDCARAVTRSMGKVK